jgi:hypothetical protein
MTTARAERKRGSVGGLGRRGAVLLALALAGLAAFIVFSRRSAPPTPSASGLAVVPEGAILLVQVDLAALRRHPLGGELLGQGRQIAGLGALHELCSSDPLETLDELVIAVPELEGVGFGLFGSGRIDPEPLVACALEIVRRRGGQPIREDGADFSIVRDASLPAGSAELAVRRGRLILAEPAYLRLALDGAGAPAAEHRVHHELRALMPPGMVVASAVLSPTQRASLRDELRAQGEPDSPFGALRDGALSLRLSERLEAEALIRCGEAAACTHVAATLVARRDELAAEPSYRLLGVAELVAGIAIAAEGERVTLRAGLELERLIGLIERLRVLEQLMKSTPGPEPARPSAPVPPADGERLVPRDNPR